MTYRTFGLRFSLLGALLALGAPASALQVEVLSVDGASAGAEFGVAVDGAGDVNGDGFADVIVGAHQGELGGDEVGTATVISGADGSTLFTFFGAEDGDGFGISVAGIGDVDLDGTPDFAVGSDMGNSVRVLSGASGLTMFEVSGTADDDLFGFSVAGPGDTNADGRPDVLVGAPGNDAFGFNSGVAGLFSGLDGTVIFLAFGDSNFDLAGIAVSGAGDANGDGRLDIAVGASGEDEDRGRATIYSGASGAALHTFFGDSKDDRFGRAVASAGDVNGDGRGDLIVGAFRDDDTGVDAGSARVFDGSTGEILHTFHGDYSGDELGVSVAGMGDLNGDGHADLLVGAYGDDDLGAESGSARVYSGMDGTVLSTLFGAAPADYFGVAVANAGDVDMDGTADLLIGAHGDDSGGVDAGSATVFSGATLPPPANLPLTADAGSLSLSAGGNVVLTLDAGPAFGSTPYFVMGSTATTPAIPIDQVSIPLSPFSPYFLFTIENPNKLPLIGTLGILDGAGRGSAAIATLGGQPQIFNGLTIYHAFVCFDIFFGTVLFASNAVPLTLLP